jgi:hypothetical protein
MNSTRDYPIRSHVEQAKAYNEGYRQGELVRKGYVDISHYMLYSSGDFPLGSFSQQSTAGYHDGLYGLKPKFLHYRETT